MIESSASLFSKNTQCDSNIVLFIVKTILRYHILQYALLRTRTVMRMKAQLIHRIDLREILNRLNPIFLAWNRKKWPLFKFSIVLFEFI